MIINATAAYVGEAIPTEYLVYSGTCINTGLVFGIEITTLFNLALPYWSDDEPVPEEAKTTDLWRISYSLQIVSVVVTTIFWLFFFKNEPLKFLIAKAEVGGTNSKTYEEACNVLRESYDL